MSEKITTAIEDNVNKTTVIEDPIEPKDLSASDTIKTNKVTETKKHKEINADKKAIAEEQKDLSVSDAMRSDNNDNADTISSDDEGSIVETMSIEHQSGGSRMDIYKKTIKDLHHKYNKYKYKHEMQRRKIKEVLKKHDQMDLYNEIIENE